jgi:hypothetical protein
MWFSSFYAEVCSRLAHIESQLEWLIRASQREVKRDEMAQVDIDKLKEKVAKNTDATNAAVALITGLAQAIRDAQDDPAELAALADKLDQDATKLGDAVTANTPSA